MIVDEPGRSSGLLPVCCLPNPPAGGQWLEEQTVYRAYSYGDSSRFSRDSLLIPIMTSGTKSAANVTGRMQNIQTKYLHMVLGKKIITFRPGKFKVIFVRYYQPAGRQRQVLNFKDS